MFFSLGIDYLHSDPEANIVITALLHEFFISIFLNHNSIKHMKAMILKFLMRCELSNN